MSKYSIGAIDLSNSHKMILEQINVNSVVLECGCASGYMTKYMKEQLGCKVYIVEYNLEDFNIAMNFAEDGICGDLLKDEWFIKFRGMKFDYILFADVLEHLYDPKSVLRKSVALLKDDGKVIVSLPNIANNDILANLYNDNWQYTNIGLLDNTHIRFFGRNNLDSLFNEVGLSITKLDYNTHAINRTEQKVSYGQEDAILLEALEKRPYGTVYQFIITACHIGYCRRNVIEKKEAEIDNKPYQYTLYYSKNEKFTDDKKIVGRICAREEIEINIDILAYQATYIRFDPIEGFECIVEKIQILYDDEPTNIISTNGKKVKDMYFFDTKDPQIFLKKMDEGIKNIKIIVKIKPIISKSQMINMLFEHITEYENSIKEKENTIEILRKENSNNIIQKEKMKQERDLAKSENIIIKNSASWKITKPLRFLSGLFKIGGKL